MRKLSQNGRRALAALGIAALLSPAAAGLFLFFAPALAQVPTPGAGSCYGNDIPPGIVLVKDPVTGLCWPQIGAPGAPGVLADNFEGSKASYSAYFNNVTVAAATTDVATIAGSATKTIRLTHAELSCTGSAGANFPATLVQRAAVDTAGTPVAMTAVKHDTGDGVATATGLNSYTANPTINSTVGTIRAGQAFASSAGTLVPVSWDFGIRNAKTAVLRGIAQQYALNLGGVTIATGVCSGGFEWTEE